MSSYAIAGVVCLALLTAAPGAHALTLHVAPGGDDAAAGTADAPLASLDGARDRIRELKAADGSLAEPVEVLIAGGEYRLRRPFTLGPEDAGSEAAPITYAAAPGARPVFSGGTRIVGWQDAGNGLLAAQVSGVAEGERYFRQLFVNGQRRQRARTPNRGYLQLEALINPFDRSDEANRTGFRFREGDLSGDWRNPTDVEVVKMFSWSTTRMPVAEIDDEQGVLRFSGRTGTDPRLIDWAGNRYYVENVFEGLDQPGEWYLDRPSGTLYYKPMRGETPTTIEAFAPTIEHLVEFYGDADAPVHHVTLRDLTFEHASWPMPEGGWTERQAQATMETAAVHGRFAEDCALEDCELRHVGAHGVWLERGCRNNRIERCHVWDVGAGGVYLGWTQVEPEASGNVVDNCFIHHLTEVHGGAIGVWIGQSSFNRVTHNEIADMNYTGISVGWKWHYGPSLAHDNLIEDNYVHHCGHLVLSDMGGIYTLGESQGTVIRHNLFEDIWCYPAYSHASGIYFDQGTTDLLVENNIVIGTTDSGFICHYGKDSIVRNNIFAYAGKFGLSLGKPEEHRSFIFERNIIYQDHPNMAGRRVTENEDVDSNLYWCTTGEEPVFCGLSLEAWREQGHDADAIFEDPRFRDPEHGDFTLAADSPALRIGFEPVSMDGIGLYGDRNWVDLPARFERQLDDPLPEAALPARISDNFDTWFGVPQPLGGQPLRAAVHTEDHPELIAISDEAAASGTQSLRVEDIEGLERSWNPHFYYRPGYTKGVGRCEFAIRIDEATGFYHEWRGASSAYKVGPTLQINHGELTVAGIEPLALPVGEWVRIEVEAPLGDAAGTWTLTVTMPDGTRHEFTDLACGSAEWRELWWIGFVSDATVPAVFYIDDLEIGME